MFNFFGQTYKDKHKLNIHIFYSNMSISPSELYLIEGADMGMFTKEEILTKNLYSEKLGKAFPIAPISSEVFDSFFEYVDKNIRA